LKHKIRDNLSTMARSMHSTFLQALRYFMWVVGILSDPIEGIS